MLQLLVLHRGKFGSLDTEFPPSPGKQIEAEVEVPFGIFSGRSFVEVLQSASCGLKILSSQFLDVFLMLACFEPGCNA